MLPSKETTAATVKLLIEIGTITGLPDTILGICTVIIHITFGIWMLGNLYIKPIGKDLAIIFVIFLIVLASNYYFHGCILSRVERAFFKTKNWCGPVSLLRYLHIDVDTTLANQIIKYGIAAPTASVVIIKLLLSGYIIFGSLFAIILTPLLFVHSQDYLWHKFLGITIPLSITFPAITGKRIIITGASRGIGKAVAKMALYNGATLILLCRPSPQLDLLHQTLPNAIIIPCDLTSFASVKHAAKKVISLFPDGIDVLFNNGGISNTTPSLTQDGYELQIQTNYLSHVLLTESLLPLLKKRNCSKIINHTSLSYCIPARPYMSSLFNRYSTFDLFEKTAIRGEYMPSQLLYQQSKLALLLYTELLNSRLANTTISIIPFQPGLCKTDIFKRSTLSTNLISLLEYIASAPEVVAENFLKTVTAPINKRCFGDPLAGPTSIFLGSTLCSDLVNISSVLYAWQDIKTIMNLNQINR